VLGIFVATFLYALLALRNVRGATDEIDLHVPALAVWAAVVLAGLCLVAFIYLLHHVAQSIRAVNVLARIGQETRARVGKLFPEDIGTGAEEVRRSPRREPPSLIVPSPHSSGVLLALDERPLWEAAVGADVALRLVPAIGDFVIEGDPLFEVWGDASKLDVRRLTDAVSLGPERTLDQDVAFGMRQLVDVAVRALSPGVNDPSTAVQAIDQLHDLLRRLVRRRFPSPDRVDEDSVVRLSVNRPAWEDYVNLALDEIRLAGSGSLQVERRLFGLLDDLLRVAPAFRRQPLLLQRRLLEQSLPRAFDAPEDAELAARPSAQSHGPH
jgi:uncharacterized membrane protein